MPGSDDKVVTAEAVTDSAENKASGTSGEEVKCKGEETSTTSAPANGTTTPTKNSEPVADGPGQAEDGGKLKSPSKEELESGPGLLAQGKRHLYVRDYPAAVSVLGEACAKISEKHGELADECADGYYHYGCALLELAREESDVLGDNVENKEAGSDDDDDDNDDEEEEEENEKAEEDGDGEPVKEDKGEEEKEKSEAEKPSADGDDVGSKKEKVKNGHSKDEDAEPAKDGEKGAEEDNEEDVNNLQLAWEMFELAKIIFERQKSEKKLAETYLKLGEVAMESENYDGAVNDMNKCLEIQKKIYPCNHRCIAETLFQLGVASSLCNNFDDSIKYFTNAGVVLERRIGNLIKTRTPDPEMAKNPFYTVDKEVEELQALLPEIKDKIADMEDFKIEYMKAIASSLIQPSGKDGVEPSTSSATPSSSSSLSGPSSSTNGAATATADSSSSSAKKTPINDISHLIRKKRKASEEPSNAKESNKKLNVDSETKEVEAKQQ